MLVDNDANTQPSIPAIDFIIDTLSVNYRSPELEAFSRAVTESLYALHCQQQNVDPTLQSMTADPKSQEPLGYVPPHYAGFVRACLILTRRNFTDTFRQRGRYIYRVVGPVTIVTIVCLFFWRMGNDSLSVYTRLGCLQQLAGGALPAVLVALDLYPRQVRSVMPLQSIHCFERNSCSSALCFFALYFRIIERCRFS